MAVAYAAFASNLTITGSGSVSSNWCIGFDSTRTSDYQATAGKQGGTTPTENTFTGTIYRNNTSVLANGLAMNGDSTIYYPSDEYSSASDALIDGWFYASESECLNVSATNGNCTSGAVTLSPGSYVTDASELNKNYYLKHTVVNDIITASYVCFVTDDEYCFTGSLEDDMQSLAQIKDSSFFKKCNSTGDVCYFKSGLKTISIGVNVPNHNLTNATTVFYEADMDSQIYCTVSSINNTSFCN